MGIKKYLSLIAVAVSLLIHACGKMVISYGTVTVNVMYQDRPLPGAKVYLKQGMIKNPNIPLDSFDQSITTDGNGSATFGHLAPDGYYLYVRGFSVVANRYVTGTDSFMVMQRSRGGDNAYQQTINTQ